MPIFIIGILILLYTTIIIPIRRIGMCQSMILEDSTIDQEQQANIRRIIDYNYIFLTSGITSFISSICLFLGLYGLITSLILGCLLLIHFILMRKHLSHTTVWTYCYVCYILLLASLPFLAPLVIVIALISYISSKYRKLFLEISQGKKGLGLGLYSIGMLLYLPFFYILGMAALSHGRMFRSGLSSKGKMAPEKIGNSDWN